MIDKEEQKSWMKKLEQYDLELSKMEDKVNKFILKSGFVMEDEKLVNDPIFTGKKVLIGNYDDYSSNQTRIILQSFGMDVEIVKSSLDIIDRIKNGYIYDIIFTNNIYQRGMFAPELLIELKKIEGFNTPVVIHTITEDSRSYFVDQLGFDEYIVKPIYASDPDKVDEIKKILKKLL